MVRAKEQCSSLLTGTSIKTLGLLTRSLVHLAAVSSHPLFSVAATSGLLVLLYIPRPLVSLLFSPTLVATLLLLAALLRSGSGSAPPKAHPELSREAPISELEPDAHLGHPGFHQKQQLFCSEFVEWGRLEVIYEEYEGEEEDDEEGGGESPEYSRPMEYSRLGVGGLESLGLCFTGSDTESDDDDGYPAVEGWDSPESLCFRWEEEGDGLIEIALEEDNLIEIDISGGR